MSIEQPKAPSPTVKDVRVALIAQLMDVMGFKHQSWISRCLHPIFYLPAQRISSLLVELDHDTAVSGWNKAVNHFLSHLVTGLQLRGAENLPLEGPLMVVCNHPAALDVVILSAAIRRNDLKFLASDIPIVQLLPNIAWHSIPVYYDISRRLHTVRSAIRHLQLGGALFLFPRGDVEPDPAVSPGAVESLSGWSASIELFLRRVPRTTTVVAAASGMLSSGWYKNPIIRLWKQYEQRQKVAEIFQIASQLITGKTPAATPTIDFSRPFSIADLGGEDAPQGAILASLVDQARQMMPGKHFS